VEKDVSKPLIGNHWLFLFTASLPRYLPDHEVPAASHLTRSMIASTPVVVSWF